jgi:hypothetical protein
VVCNGRANTRWQYVSKIAPLSLAYIIHHGVLCLLRVYALYGRSQRVLGVLLFLGTGSIVTALVCLFPLTSRLVHACLNIFLLPIKAALSLSRRSGGETIPVISSLAGCAQFTPHIGYVTELTCDLSPGMIRLVVLVLGVDVSHRIAYGFNDCCNSRDQSLLSHGLGCWVLTV